MNERYLVRGKRFDNGEWVIGLCVHDGLIRVHNSACALSTQDMSVDGNFECPVVRVDSTTVGQCTGLKDKSGKFIFEGDYISFGGEQFEIKYSDACFWMCQPDYSTELHTTIGQGDIEIIRTIWEETQ